jgi:hypothetical protein
MTIGSSRKKLCGLLTANEVSVLGPLFDNRNKYNSLYAAGHTAPGWCRCRDLGGARDSHHSLTLRRLCAKGLVDTMRIESPEPAEKQLLGYRISAGGEDLWREYLSFVESSAPRTPLVLRAC